jgi:hypothetical protein
MPTITTARLRLVGMTAATIALLPAGPAAASPTVPVTPFVDCVRSNGDPVNPVYTAYFGYENTYPGQITFSFPIGDQNNLFPGSIDQGQPTQFNAGNYPRVVAVQFDGHFIPTVTWELNGIDATASASSPACDAGVTAPASDLGTTSATLNGAVVPDGQDTTYSFEYGTTTTFGTATPSQDAGSGTVPQLVQSKLTGLVPATRYYFRLDTTNAMTGTTHGATQTFTTSAVAPAPPSAASITAAAGGAQTATVGSAFGTALQAKVLDGSGGPVSGVPVTFAVPAGGAAATFPSGSGTTVVSTDASGVATAPTLTANAIPGTYSVTATAAGVATGASFSLTNAPQTTVHQDQHRHHHPHRGRPHSRRRMRGRSRRR